MRAIGGIVERRGVHQQVRKAVAALELPVPLSPDDLCDAVAIHTGRYVELMRWQDFIGSKPPPFVALCVPTKGIDIIVIDGSVSRARQLHGIAHEAAHLIFRHVPTTLKDLGDDQRAGQDDEIDLLCEVLSGIDGAGPKDVRQGVLLRSAYTDLQEQQAEWFADEIGTMTGLTPLLTECTRTDPDGRVLGRLVRVLGPVQRRIR